jgi:hypothetical protein
MFVEEGFRIRFANGETIDFYADSAAEKDGWMRALSDIVGRAGKQSKSWTELVLKRDRAIAQAAAKQDPRQPAWMGMKSAPPTPGARQSSQGKRPNSQQGARPSSQQGSRPHPQADRPSSSSAALAPPPVRKDTRHLSEVERRQKSRSMIF